MRKGEVHEKGEDRFIGPQKILLYRIFDHLPFPDPYSGRGGDVIASFLLRILSKTGPLTLFLWRWLANFASRHGLNPSDLRVCGAQSGTLPSSKASITKTVTE